MKKANPTTVGGFVIGAAVLAVVAVGVFGSGRFFEERTTMVAFFDESLMGLRAGAPVELRGIQVGTVTNFWVQVDPATLEFTLPVLMEIETSKIRGVAEAARSGPRLPELIDQGLRAQLAVQSLVTGQQTIQLLFRPDTEVKLAQTDLPYQQLPTVPSAFEEIGSDVSVVVDRASALLDRMNDILSDKNRGEIEKILTNVTKITADLGEAVVSLNALMTDARAVVANIDASNPKLQRLLDSGQKTLEAYTALAMQTTTLVDENRKGVKDFTSTGLYELSNLAVDAQAAVEQFRRVMEELERDPARFLLGQPGDVEVQ